MKKNKILFICGSMNQTTMMHQVAKHLSWYDLYFTPYYGDGLVKILSTAGLLSNTILGGRFRENTERYLEENNLKTDYRGEGNNYDLIFTCSDLIIPNNIQGKKIILIQEGMTDRENIFYNLARRLKLPRYFSGTAMNGQSNLYKYFCVASEGYKQFFVDKGVDPEKIKVTGIPNFDNAASYLQNNFPFKNYVLAATSDVRETFRYENRKEFLKYCLKIADGRKLIIKLHPNENFIRAIIEIKTYIPDAIIYTSGNTNHMIANCDVLITRYSSVVYIGLALGKEVYSDFDINLLKKLLPLQNGGTSAKKIAALGESLLNKKIIESDYNTLEPLVSLNKIKLKEKYEAV